MDIVFVNMPYAWIQRPSAALGLLQAILESKGIAATTIYANMLFTEHVGLPDYAAITGCRAIDGVADWTFSHIAFPECHPDPYTFVELLLARDKRYRTYGRERLSEQLVNVQERATDFTNRLAEHIVNLQVPVVGCSSTFCQHVPSLALLRRIRNLNPEMITLMGGANCETIMGRTTHELFPWVDYVVSGEADDLISGLVRSILERGRNVEAHTLATGVFGPVHRVEGYPSVKTDGTDDAPRAMAASLHARPIPNYDAYFQTLECLLVLKDIVTPGLPLETSRSCWWGERRACTFCGLNGRDNTYRTRPSHEVLEEMEAVRTRYGINRVQVVDNVLDRRHFNELIPRLEAMGAPYSVFFETRADLTQNQVRALRDAGVAWIQPGIESLDSRTLKLMNKGTKSWQNVQLLKWCREYGVRCNWFILHDIPGDTDDSYQKMAELIPLLSHLQPPVDLLNIEYSRYSDFHDNPQEYRLRLQPPEPFRYVYPLSEEQLATLVYIFENALDLNIARSPMLSQLLSRPGVETLKSEVASWQRAFWSDSRPELFMNVDVDSLAITDTRAVAVEKHSTVSGIDRDLCLACDAATHLVNLFTMFQKRGIPRKDVEESIHRLKEKKVVIELDGRLLALMLRQRPRELPHGTQWPGGSVDPVKFAALRAVGACERTREIRNEKDYDGRQSNVHRGT